MLNIALKLCALDTEYYQNHHVPSLINLKTCKLKLKFYLCTANTQQNYKIMIEQLYITLLIIILDNCDVI